MVISSCIRSNWPNFWIISGRLKLKGHIIKYLINLYSVTCEFELWTAQEKISFTESGQKVQGNITDVLNI